VGGQKYFYEGKCGRQGLNTPPFPRGKGKGGGEGQARGLTSLWSANQCLILRGRKERRPKGQKGEGKRNCIEKGNERRNSLLSFGEN